jgi:uncharacterized protein YecT (DUF1311 family)
LIRHRIGATMSRDNIVGVGLSFRPIASREIGGDMGNAIGTALMAIALLGAPLPPSWNVRPADRTSWMLTVVGTSAEDGQEGRALEHFQDNQTQDQEQESQQQQASQLALAKAKKAEQSANEALSARWDAITPDARAQVLQSQRVWINDETADCNKQADAASGDDVAKDTVRAKCDTVATQARTQWLKQYLPPGAGR